MHALRNTLFSVVLAGTLAGCVYEEPGPRYGYGYSSPGYYQPAPSYSFGFSYYGGGDNDWHHHRRWGS